MHVGAVKCRFICSYCWFDGTVSCSYSRSKKPLNAGRHAFECRSLQLRSAQHSCLVAARLADKRPPLQATHLPNPDWSRTRKELHRKVDRFLLNRRPVNRVAATKVHVARSPRLRGFDGRSRAGRPWPLAANSVSRQRHGRCHWHLNTADLVTAWPRQVRRGVTIVGDALQLPARRSCHQPDSQW